MTVTKLAATAAAGYEGSGSLSIQYYIPGPTGLNRTAYLPDTPEGQEVLGLLRTAFDRRLCFTVGTSMTTGAKNVLVWNIHHKSALAGGVQSHGYPDPTYLTRVKEELLQYGIQ
jgi:deltex-like protein